MDEGGEREAGQVGARNRCKEYRYMYVSLWVLVCTAPTPRQGHKPYFTCFNIELTRDHKSIIRELTILSVVLYMDKNGGWKGKAQTAGKKWNALKILIILSLIHI